jgi:hypothetical protein
MDTNEKDKKFEILGFIAEDKVSETLGKIWAGHREASAALTAAREAVSASKSKVREALVAKFNLDPAVDFWISSDGRVKIVKSLKPKRQRGGTALPDLGASVAAAPTNNKKPRAA